MKNISFIIIIFCLIAFSNTFSQELKSKKRVSGDYIEEFTVLKKDKKIKHGQYVKFRVNTLDKKGIEIIGFYENNNKTGNWLYFNHNGYLESEGQYINDKKSGLWQSYYRIFQPDSNTVNSINQAFEINQGIEFNANGDIFIKRSKLVKSSEGVYQSGEKKGAWNYYSTDGSMIHKFDHSASKMLEEKYDNPINSTCPYLGGCERFFQEYQKFLLKPPYEPSKVTLTINSKLNGLSINVFSLTGSEQFAEDIKTNLYKMNNDFLFIDDKPIFLDVRTEGFTGGAFSKIQTNLRK